MLLTLTKKRRAPVIVIVIVIVKYYAIFQIIIVRYLQDPRLWFSRPQDFYFYLQAAIGLVFLLFPVLQADIWHFLEFLPKIVKWKSEIKPEEQNLSADEDITACKLSVNELQWYTAKLITNVLIAMNDTWL